MYIFPAIDLYENQAVRLYQGDYSQMDRYSKDPVALAGHFVQLGASHLHLVDLMGARSGTCPHLPLICRIKEQTRAFCQVGGGIRSMEVIEQYLSAGLDRVILGTSAVTDPQLLKSAVARYKDRIAVGVDIRDGQVAVSGWKASSQRTTEEFCRELTDLGVRTVICTDISRDGALQGPSFFLYRRLSSLFPLQIIASGGVSSVADLQKLAELNLSGAIVGKAYYTGAIDLQHALEVIR
ncbi:1-(5-phosphoribosyl)-5-[(5-phosphoribosylamino)methylideneamino]imidazole-4-carboxamide isomerase [Suipraeoptans intestinalis]|uniref:1-(5-phosphoribosyl)-5-[(5-phosphoribosylamino)methylideneamino] imidazole-4-carboxamide isomerase n=1 Tax=Suipraeoptans intestinalis TaxID=2606628 RepID=A0A6N7USW8_9FIRM|nr:1-(5-phosphoribosyl)-5-[(5-phosphoribosylamino)methylideneamino]imidazole-4-carboxamide isomerase [Suipraeoptans intestinalis]MDD7770802.1 1-(5-phosphoribosyl)-5-[(5-phosphoribosylamino)methylideneamino]imidazole-4-carboxamide isomerase [Suipraeoptans intestinalis]MDY3121005.1 1-(5-phosphoribosyl)-5-[(5-phosphoribosylamino)methylideneamino]imidazole-4-carboxamide isomerase [Suipraeoptans intestinalis]MSR94261.1 1-(5-phosphoribosyl)-5-[(5-phosphoribosylamino)methylideneamino]imidazole-4-carbox